MQRHNAWRPGLLPRLRATHDYRHWRTGNWHSEAEFCRRAGVCHVYSRSDFSGLAAFSTGAPGALSFVAVDFLLGFGAASRYSFETPVLTVLFRTKIRLFARLALRFDRYLGLRNFVAGVDN